jgi:hypothetical protein
MNRRSGHTLCHNVIGREEQKKKEWRGVGAITSCYIGLSISQAHTGNTQYYAVQFQRNDYVWGKASKPI